MNIRMITLGTAMVAGLALAALPFSFDVGSVVSAKTAQAKNGADNAAGDKGGRGGNDNPAGDKGGSGTSGSGSSGSGSSGGSGR